MGNIISALVVILTCWGALARIMPDVFEVRRTSKLMEFLWGPKSIGVAVMSVGCLLAFYIWTFEQRLSMLSPASATISAANSPDETGLQFVSWGPFPDGSGCHAVIDATKLPAKLRDNFDIALVCGFSDPSIDLLKDARISLSQLFTPQNQLSISANFSKIMVDSLERDREATVSKIQPKPRFRYGDYTRESYLDEGRITSKRIRCGQCSQAC